MSAHARWVVRLARLGYAAKGIVYIVIGYLAVRASTGDGGRTTDARGALRSIGEGTVGHASLAVIGIGLLGYAIWRVVAAATDAEGHGGGLTGIATRLGQAGRGLIYGGLAVEALRLLLRARGSSGSQAEHWTARVLAAPHGRWLVIGAGVGVVAYALHQFYRAVKDDRGVREHLDLRDVSRRAARWIVRFGRFGTAARAVVLALVGWFLVRAALRYDPRQAGGIDESLATLAAQPHGRVLLGAVAAGLIAYGLFQLAHARWRRMT